MNPQTESLLSENVYVSPAVGRRLSHTHTHTLFDSSMREDRVAPLHEPQLLFDVLFLYG